MVDWEIAHEIVGADRNVYCGDDVRLSDTKGTEPDVTLQICKQRCLNQARCNFILFGINIWYTANRCVLFTSCDNPIEYASGDPKVYRRPSSGNKTKLSIKRNHVILFSTLLLLKHKLLIFPQFSDTCNIISVTNASYANCNGLYGHQKNLSVDWRLWRKIVNVDWNSS